MKQIVALLAVVLLTGCGTTVRTHTQTPTTRYASKYVEDAKTHLSRARSTNEEIDIEIKKLLEISE
jgi:uncharacterized protein YceK